MHCSMIPGPRHVLLDESVGCLFQNCYLSGCCILIPGTGITPNYIESTSLSVSPWCDCLNSGNYMDDCLKFLNFFKDNLCLSEYLSL